MTAPAWMPPLTVLCFGEALIDMRGERHDGGNRYLPQPGGAPANVAVGIARLGGRARFAGQVGADLFGDDIARALAHHGVDVSLLARSGSALTALALVSLDAAGERSFSFYRTGTADLGYRAAQMPQQALADAGIFHICSNTLTEPDIRDTTRALMTRARQAGCLVSFDINYRPQLWPDPAEAPAIIRELAQQADLVKFSREELAELYGGSGPARVRALLDGGSGLVVVSDGAAPVRAYTGTGEIETPAPPVAAVDTTAAGDALVAGLLFRLATEGVSAAGLKWWLAEPGRLSAAMDFAVRCGAFTATRFGAFDALPRQQDLRVPESRNWPEAP